MNTIRDIAKRESGRLNSIDPSSENDVLVKAVDATTRIVGKSIHLRSSGLRSAIINITPQEKAITDARPIGYTISVTTIRSGIQTRMVIAKSAIAALQ